MEDIYSQDDYKSSLKERFRLVQERRPAFTWRKIAGELSLQYTYLSKALNDPSTHLSEDHLFALCRSLEFFPDEIEFILMQRALAQARDPERKSHIDARIRQARQERNLNADKQIVSSSRLNEEIRYLLEPICQVIHVALYIPSYRRDPRRLCGPLGISPEQLNDYLRVLSRNDHIKLGETAFEVTHVNPAKIHFGPEHFLMRFHLTMVRSQMIARLTHTPVADKYSFLVTFNLDEPSYEQVKMEFQKFLKKVERIAHETRDKHVYQMSFDLFKWL